MGRRSSAFGNEERGKPKGNRSTRPKAEHKERTYPRRISTGSVKLGEHGNEDQINARATLLLAHQAISGVL